jgi:hypothetical protein
MKWHRYARAVRIVALEVGDTYAMSALHAAEAHVPEGVMMQARPLHTLACRRERPLHHHSSSSVLTGHISSLPSY